MGGFIPLIEAFIAMALTMLALTTGVSAIVGTIQRAWRSRARGLRQMMTYFYRNEIQPELDRLGRVHAALATELDPPALERAQFLVDTTLMPVVVEGIRVSSVTGAGPDAASAAAALAARAPQGLDPRLTRIFRTQPDPTGGEGSVAIDLDEWLSWSSLRYSLDTVTIDEFKAKFSASTLGDKLRRHVPPDRFAAELDHLLDRYKAHGNAASERFGRTARILSFIAAFALACFANVDAFNLLGTYLAQPELRRQLIAEYERSGTAALKGVDGNVAGSARLADLRRDQEDLAKLARDLPDGEARQRVERAADALRTSTTVVSDVQATVLAATQTFPVGWNLYPNCTATSADVRCAALRARPRGSWPPCEARGDCSLFDYLGVALEHDTAALWRWFGGVFVAGLMLGLGTPFWVQAVNGLLRARHLMRGGSGDEGEVRPSSRSAAAGTAGAPTASPAAASAPPQRLRATL